MKLAAMAEYRKCLVPEGAGQKTRAGIANLNLFRVIYPNGDIITRPDEEPNISAARRDCYRLRDRLKLGRLRLEVRELFGGDGAFLALPPKMRF
jgi:hypothetical protein